jgi:sulfite exporter TauE/SafE/copper chaperone CopZ
MKKHSLYVHGTHCSSCKILIEETLIEHEEITGVKVDLHRQTVEIDVNNIDSAEQLVGLLNPLLSAHKYTLSIEKKNSQKDFKNLSVALPIGMAVLFLFFLLQKSGIINFGFEGGLTPWTALFIGVVASISTCLAVVGGLILSLSAKISQDVSTFRPFALFHTGRVVGFAILGALLGLLGNAISINHTITATLGLFAALVMVILGANLLGIFDFTKRLQLTLPNGFFQKISKIEQGFGAPLITGMQIASLASGNWLQGGIIMLMFSLGTLPMLLLISFSSYKFANSKFAPIFYQSAGIVVIGLGIFAFLGGLAGLGVIRPLFNI